MRLDIIKIKLGQQMILHISAMLFRQRCNLKALRSTRLEIIYFTNCLLGYQTPYYWYC